ncbi:hypothetical protein C8R43DRAFT_1120267 [Mycena crocata]|nr:hypothetical protein C8R43DRAFT_1120267 [Mycena crocata]
MTFYPTPPRSRSAPFMKREEATTKTHIKSEETSILWQPTKRSTCTPPLKTPPKSEVDDPILRVTSSPARESSSDEAYEVQANIPAERESAAARQSSRAPSNNEEEVDELDADNTDSSDVFTDVYSETDGAVGRFLRVPTAQEFQANSCRPIKNYHRKVLNHSARAATRVVHRHKKNMSLVGRALGLKHNPIRRAVLNEYEPPDDLSKDFDVLHPDFRIEFPPLPGWHPVDNTTASTSSKRKRAPKLLMQTEPESDEDQGRYLKPHTRARTTLGAAAPTRALRSSNGRAPVVLIQRKAPSAVDDPKPSLRSPSDQIRCPNANLATTGTALLSELPITSRPDSASSSTTHGSHGCTSLDVFLQNVGGYNLTELRPTFGTVGIKSMHDLFTLAQLPAARRSRTLTLTFEAHRVSKLQIISLANAIADLRPAPISSPSEQPAVASGFCHPTSIAMFLQDVGGFNLSDWSARFAEVGIVTMKDIAPLGRLPDARRQKILVDLLEPDTLTTLHLVSLSLSIADLVLS